MGYCYSKEELDRIKNLVADGLTNREIALTLGRSEAGIRNVRYRQKMKNKAKNETKALFQQRDRLRLQISELQRKHTELTSTIDLLEKTKSKVEASLKLDMSVLQLVLIKALTTLKQKRPDLFLLSEKEQKIMFANLFLKRILS